MMSGVRASSIRIESTSSTIAKLMPALDHLSQRELHVVAQVVEAELVVRAVRDVRRVGLLPLLIAEVVLDAPDRHPEEPVQAPHPFESRRAR